MKEVETNFPPGKRAVLFHRPLSKLPSAPFLPSSFMTLLQLLPPLSHWTLYHDKGSSAAPSGSSDNLDSASILYHRVPTTLTDAKSSQQVVHNIRTNHMNQKVDYRVRATSHALMLCSTNTDTSPTIRKVNSKKVGMTHRGHILQNNYAYNHMNRKPKIRLVLYIFLFF